MKRLHKQLLAACLPYLLLIVVVWIVQLSWLEPAERRRIRTDAKREVQIQALMIGQNLKRAFHQLELLAESPGLASDDATVVAATAKQLSEAHAESFSALHVDSLTGGNPVAPLAPALGPDLEELKQGHSIISLLGRGAKTQTLTLALMVPMARSGGAPTLALVGEVKPTEIFPFLDPQSNPDLTKYSVIDARGREMNAASLQAATPGLRAPQATLWSEFDQERMAAQIVPWNWQAIQTIRWSQALGGLRFQRNLLSALCLLAMMATAAVVVWLNRKSSARLTKLIETIQIFGASDPSVRVADDQPDEIGRLAETFNCMADDVAHTQRRLQKQLAEHEQSPSQWQGRVAELEQQLIASERYASHVSHEVQGPLATLEGFAAALAAAARSGDWEQLDRDQARVKSICGRLKDMSDALLRLAKGSPASRSESVSLSLAAKEAADLVGATDGLSISDELPTVTGDLVLWRHVFVNLLTNAITASEPSRPQQIEIGCERRNGERVCFVRDHGHGMSAGEIEQAFHGVGLGLVRRIVEHHGGKVWAESRGPGAGTTVWWTVT